MEFTIKQRIFLVESFVICNNYVDPVLKYIKKYPGAKIPTKSDISELIQMWRTYGTVGDDIEDVKKNHTAERNKDSEDQRLREGSNVLRRPTKTNLLKRTRTGNQAGFVLESQATTSNIPVAMVAGCLMCEAEENTSCEGCLQSIPPPESESPVLSLMRFQDRGVLRFPLQRPGVLTKWLLAIKRHDFFPTYAHRLCSAHFTQGCFWKSIGKRILKDNAVPTVFDFSIRQKKVSKKASNDHASRAKKVKRSHRSKNREMLVPEIKCEIEEGSIEFDESRETSEAECSSGSRLASEVKSEPLSDGEGRTSNGDVAITPATATNRTSFAGVFVKEEPQSTESEMEIPVTEELNLIKVKGEPIEGTVKLEVVETMVAADSC